jgi:hypothetical protein
MMARGDAVEGLHPDIAAALDEVLGGGGLDAGLALKLRTLIENSLAANFADSDVRAVIEATAAFEREAGDGA